jgi:uncharacterized protein (TIGR03437 family)
MRILRLVLVLSLAGIGLLGATFGTTYPFAGEFSDLVLDESRSLIYAANFTANRIEVFHTGSRTWQTPIRLGINPSAVALSPDGRILMILNFGSPSMFLLNLENRALQTVALPDTPRAVEFGSDGAALIITTNRVLRYDPVTGSITAVLTEIGPLLGSLPVQQPTFPAEIVNARLAVTPDRNTIFAVGSLAANIHFAFYYLVPTRRIVAAPCSRLISNPERFASIAPDGSKAMGGGLLRDSQLRILADFTPSGVLPIRVAPAVPTAPPPNAPPPTPETVVGATVFSRDGSTIYASLVDPTQRTAPPVIYVMDSDNLTVRERILIPDRLTGKMISNAGGTQLYAVSQTGLTIIPIGELSAAPRLASSTDIVTFRFGPCNKLRASVTFDLVNLGSGRVPFTLTAQMEGLRLEPSSGTTPARITASFDPEFFFNVRGTATGAIQVNSEAAVNVPQPLRVLANLLDTDQRGTIFPLSGDLRDLLVDDTRERFYILDSRNNRLLVFDLNDFTLKKIVRTGYFPLHMAVTQDQRRLLVTNAQSETVSVIHLDTLESEGFIYCPCGSYARSIAVSANATLLTTAIDRGQLLRTADNREVSVIVTEGRMNRVYLADREARQETTVGVFTNFLPARTLLTATPSGRYILIAEDANSIAKLYEADSDTYVVARTISDQPLRGGVAAADTGLYSAGAVILGTALAPLTEFRDAPNEHTGLTFVGTQIVRTLRPATGGGPGLMTRVDTSTLRSLRPVRLAEAPLAPADDQPLRRTLAANRTGSTFISLSTSGFQVIPGTFDAFVSPPLVRAVTNAADGGAAVAPGALISIFGEGLAPLTARAGAAPLPTFLADTCLLVNNTIPLPLLFLSPGQINAQLPFEVTSRGNLTIHAAGGVSEPFPLDVSTAAPALFRSTFAGQAPQALPIILRASNQEPITNSNPARRGEVLVLFGNGLGRVSPALRSGDAAPLDQLLSAVVRPEITVGGRPAELLFAGLAPGFVGLNQLNVRVPLDAPLGFDIPLQITSGGVSSETGRIRVAAELER